MILVLILLIFLILAIYWEFSDFKRLDNLPKADGQIDKYIFYGCFSYENSVSWRSIFIGSIISLFFVYIVVSEVVLRDGWTELGITLVFLSIFLPMYVVDVFRKYHFYRPLCAKVRPDLRIL